MLKKIVIALLLLAAVLVAAIFIGRALLSNALPDVKSDDAKSLRVLERVLKATHNDAFEKARLVHFQLDNGRFFLWDKAREKVRVTHKNEEVFIDLKSAPAGDPSAIKGKASDRKALVNAHKWFINDLFWLHPFSSFKNEGVELKVSPDERTLLVSFTKGGHTPGDQYALLLDEAGRPKAWRLYTGVLPIAGLEASFDEWQKSGENTLISHVRQISFASREVTFLKIANDFATLGIEDPFEGAAASQPAN